MTTAPILIVDDDPELLSALNTFLELRGLRVDSEPDPRRAAGRIREGDYRVVLLDIVMLIAADFPELKTWRVEILGTDISRRVLERARSGLYSPLEVQRGLPMTMLVRFFRQDDQNWQIAPEIRKMVKYQQTNLLQSYAALGRFDVIFCRNVLIYFDELTKIDVLNRMAGVLPPDGFLFLGGAETVLGRSSEFKRGDTGGFYYQRRQSLVSPSSPKQNAAAG